MAAQMCTLYLVRHGQTDWNVSKTIQGQTNIPLNEKGEAQAKELRESLEHIHFDAVFSSDLLRAKRTADILNLERQLAIETTSALRERSFGRYEGKSMNEDFNKLHELLEEYKSHPHIVESQVETSELLVGRALTFIREVSIAYSGKTVLVVAHGDLMITLLVHLGYIRTRKQVTALQNLAYIQLKCDGVNFEVKETAGITLTK